MERPARADARLRRAAGTPLPAALGLNRGVRGRPRQPRSPQNRTPALSIWSVQVSTLLMPYTQEELRHLTIRLRMTLDNTLGNPNAMQYLMFPRPGWEQDRNLLRFDTGLLEHMRFFRGAIEVGEVSHRVHAHTMLWLSHRSCVGFNEHNHELQDMLRIEWNRLGPYVREVAPVPDDAYNSFHRPDGLNFNVRIKSIRPSLETRHFWYQNKTMDRMGEWLAERRADPSPGEEDEPLLAAMAGQNGRPAAVTDAGQPARQ